MTRRLPFATLRLTLVKVTRLRGRRLEKGWTLDQLRDAAGISAHALSLLERGIRQPRPSTITKLARALDCQPADLMEPEP